MCRSCADFVGCNATGGFSGKGDLVGVFGVDVGTVVDVLRVIGL